MSTHGRSGVSRFMLGSNASATIELATRRSCCCGRRRWLPVRFPSDPNPGAVGRLRVCRAGIAVGSGLCQRIER